MSQLVNLGSQLRFLPARPLVWAEELASLLAGTLSALANRRPRSAAVALLRPR